MNPVPFLNPELDEPFRSKSRQMLFPRSYAWTRSQKWLIIITALTLLTLGAAGSLVQIYEKNALRPGIRPICQATKLLDRDPIVRRMAEQDVLIMGRAAKPYLDQVRAKARPKLQQAIDRIWQRILDEGR